MTLRRIDLTLPTPEENLALDEALLRLCDDEVRRQLPTGYLRFWESPQHFVVLGVSRRLEEDVRVEECRQQGIPVLRRASGGGTVVQGPGCFNFSLVFPLPEHPELLDVGRSYEIIVERSAAALEPEGGGRKGGSDLVVGDLKFGGSAQKRTPRALLHHGTVLHDFDISLVSQWIEEPAKRPEYRGERRHGEFITNIPITPEEARRRLSRTWDARAVERTWSPPDLEELVREKYSRREWTERF